MLVVPTARQWGRSIAGFRISKMGDKMTRSSLTSAAQHHVKHGNTALAAWGLALSEKLWKGGVHTAVARKLAVTMLAMWKPGKSYDSHPRAAASLTPVMV